MGRGQAYTLSSLCEETQQFNCVYIAYEYQVVTGKVEGKTDRGRQRQTFLGCLGKILDRRGVDIIHLAQNTTLYHAVTSNVRI